MPQAVRCLSAFHRKLRRVVVATIFRRNVQDRGAGEGIDHPAAPPYASRIGRDLDGQGRDHDVTQRAAVERIP